MKYTDCRLDGGKHRTYYIEAEHFLSMKKLQIAKSILTVFFFYLFKVYPMGCNYGVSLAILYDDTEDILIHLYN